MAEPRDLAEQLELEPSLPSGGGERFSGYGVMACPFASGDILCHRRFPASSVGPAYTSIWHRDPEGRWTFYQDASPELACTRVFGSAVMSAIETPIATEWTGPRRLRLSTDVLQWELRLASTLPTRTLNGLARGMPDALWRSDAVLKVLGGVAGRALRVGRLALSGEAPNRQHFIANPLLVWTIPEARATLNGRDLGAVSTPKEQARLGDFWIPRNGLFAVGHALFDAFDETRHLPAR